MRMKLAVGAISVTLSLFVVSGSSTVYGAPPQTHKNQTKHTNSSAEQENTGAAQSGCALLPSSLLEKTFGQAFDDDPMDTKAPPAYDGAWGTSCRYSPKPPFTKGHKTTVDFMLYKEVSAAEAKQTFDKAAAFFEDKAKPRPSGIGDEAYWGLTTDDPPMLHVLTGKVHYSLELEPANEQKLLELAAVLRGRL